MENSSNNKITNMKEYTDQAIRPYMAAIKADQLYYQKQLDKYGVRLDQFEERFNSHLTAYEEYKKQQQTALEQQKTEVEKLEEEIKKIGDVEKVHLVYKYGGHDPRPGNHWYYAYTPPYGKKWGVVLPVADSGSPILNHGQDNWFVNSGVPGLPSPSFGRVDKYGQGVPPNTRVSPYYFVFGAGQIMSDAQIQAIINKKYVVPHYNSHWAYYGATMAVGVIHCSHGYQHGRYANSYGATGTSSTPGWGSNVLQSGGYLGQMTFDQYTKDSDGTVYSKATLDPWPETGYCFLLEA